MKERTWLKEFLETRQMGRAQPIDMLKDPRRRHSEGPLEFQSLAFLNLQPPLRKQRPKTCTHLPGFTVCYPAAAHLSVGGQCLHFLRICLWAQGIGNQRRNLKIGGNERGNLQNTKKSFIWALPWTVVFIYIFPVRTYKMAAAQYCVFHILGN